MFHFSNQDSTAPSYVYVIKNKNHFCASYGKSKKEPPQDFEKIKGGHYQCKKEKPVILITNDDGVSAPGIRNLVEAVKDLGKIIVVAPDKPQSGMGHAITIGRRYDCIK